ncbi:MAG: hypothetical protein V1710_05250 [Candidatus Bathyarchaeota archaeon]
MGLEVKSVIHKPLNRELNQASVYASPLEHVRHIHIQEIRIIPETKLLDEAEDHVTDQPIWVLNPLGLYPNFSKDAADFSNTPYLLFMLISASYA